jgi:hypothetical protein
MRVHRSTRGCCADKLGHPAGAPVWSGDLLLSDDSGQSDSDSNVAKVVVELQLA